MIVLRQSRWGSGRLRSALGTRGGTGRMTFEEETRLRIHSGGLRRLCPSSRGKDIWCLWQVRRSLKKVKAACGTDSCVAMQCITVPVG